jgi:hypothetical protein
VPAWFQELPAQIRARYVGIEWEYVPASQRALLESYLKKLAEQEKNKDSTR